VRLEEKGKVRGTHERNAVAGWVGADAWHPSRSACQINMVAETATCHGKQRHNPGHMSTTEFLQLKGSRPACSSPTNLSTEPVHPRSAPNSNPACTNSSRVSRAAHSVTTSRNLTRRQARNFFWLRFLRAVVSLVALKVPNGILWSSIQTSLFSCMLSTSRSRACFCIRGASTTDC
jgi:hypothetical protein